MVGRIIRDARDGRGAVIVRHDYRRVAESVVGLAEAIVVSASDQHHDRARMTVA